MKQSRIKNILQCLKSDRVDIGWTTFLDVYSSLIRSIAYKFQGNNSEADDCYEYICAKLSDDNFRRLQAFDPSGPAQFRTWLTTVVANLCKDWRRSRYGRRRPPRFVQELPEVEQSVFRLLFQQGMTHHECLHVLKARFPELDLEDIQRINSELYASLSSNQHWQLSLSKHDSLPEDDIELAHESPTSRPDLELQHIQDAQRLESALARLEPQQRLLLRLRYQQDLTLNEVANLVGFDDLHKARRAVEKALKALKKVFDL